MRISITDKAGYAHPTPDPCLAGRVSHIRQSFGPDCQLDDITEPRTEIDESVRLSSSPSFPSDAVLHGLDAADQLNFVSDIAHDAGKIGRTEHIKGRYVSLNGRLYFRATDRRCRADFGGRDVIAC